MRRLSGIQREFVSWGKCRASDGMTLIELMIALGIGSVVVLGISTAIVNSMNAMRSVEANNDINQFIVEATSALQSPDVCKESLLPIGVTKTILATNTPASLPINKLKYPGPSGKDLAVKDGNLPGSKFVRVKSIELTNYRSMGIVGAEARFMADIKVTLLRGSSGQVMLGGEGVRPRSIPIMLRMTDATGAFSSCNTFGLSTEQMTALQESMCLSMSGTWNGTSCAPPPPPNAQTTCASLGGNWGNSGCTLASQATAPPTSAASCVATYGPGWTWNGSACVPPGAGAPCAPMSGGPGSGQHGEITAMSFWDGRPAGDGCISWQCRNGNWVCVAGSSGNYK